MDSLVSCLVKLGREESVYCADCAETEDFLIQMRPGTTKCPYCGSLRIVSASEYAKIRERQDREVLAQLPGGLKR